MVELNQNVLQRSHRVPERNVFTVHYFASLMLHNVQTRDKFTCMIFAWTINIFILSYLILSYQSTFHVATLHRFLIDIIIFGAKIAGKKIAGGKSVANGPCEHLHTANPFPAASSICSFQQRSFWELRAASFVTSFTKLQALAYDMLPPTTAISDYTIRLFFFFFFFFGFLLLLL